MLKGECAFIYVHTERINIRATPINQADTNTYTEKKGGQYGGVIPSWGDNGTQWQVFKRCFDLTSF